jgi:hypothetical protein
MEKVQTRKAVPPRKPRREKLRFLDPILISLPEFSRLSGLGQTLVRRLLNDGTLPHTVIGKRIWIIRDDAISWLRRQVEPRPAA